MSIRTTVFYLLIVVACYSAPAQAASCQDVAGFYSVNLTILDTKSDKVVASVSAEIGEGTCASEVCQDARMPSLTWFVPVVVLIVLATRRRAGTCRHRDACRLHPKRCTCPVRSTA